MPGAAFSFFSPPVPPAWCRGCSSTYLVPGSCPAPPEPSRAGCYQAGTRPSCPLHARHLILCSPFLGKTGNAAAEPRFLSVLAAGSGLSREPRVSSPALSRACSCFLGHLPSLFCHTEALEPLVALGDGVSPSGFGAEKSRLREVQ